MRPISNKAFINIPLRKGCIGVNDGRRASLIFIICITYRLDSGRVGEFKIEVPEHNVNTMVMLINLRTFKENILGCGMGDPNLRREGEKGEVSCLGGHANLSDSLQQSRWYGIPRTSAEGLKCSVFSL